MAVLWTAWTLTAVVGLAYAALSFASFARVYDEYILGDSPPSTRSLLVACFYGGFLVFVYVIVSCCQLFWLTIRKKNRSVGFWYGGVTSASFNLGLICLLCALVMQGYRDEVNSFTTFSETDKRVFEWTYILGYVATAFFIVNFGTLYYGQWRMRKGTDDAEKALLG